MRNSVYNPADLPPGSTLSVLGKRSFSMQCGQLIAEHVPKLDLQSRASVKELMQDVSKGGYVLIPFQNFSSTEVDEHIELLRTTPNIRIVGDAIIEVRMAAIGTMNSDLERVRRVYSHAQGLRQCTAFVSPNWLPNHEESVSKKSTDAGVLSLMENGPQDDAIALASHDSIPKHLESDLRIIKSGVSNQEMRGKQNATHFLVLHGNGEPAELLADGWRHLCIITPPDQRGIMEKITGIIARNGGDMNVLLSRPIDIEEHTFIVGIQGAVDMEPDFKKMFDELKAIPSAGDDVPVVQPLGSWSTYIRDPNVKSRKVIPKHVLLS